MSEDPYNKKFMIELDEYQISNLRAALEAIGYPANKNLPDCPLNSLNTGDWVGELYNRLPETNYYPNSSAANMVKASLESSYLNLLGIIMNDLRSHKEQIRELQRKLK